MIDNIDTDAGDKRRLTDQITIVRCYFTLLAYKTVHFASDGLDLSYV